MNVFAIASALASTSTLLKYVAFFYGNVIANSQKQGLVCIGLRIENWCGTIILGRNFHLLLGVGCTQELPLEMESLGTLGCLPLFFSK